MVIAPCSFQWINREFRPKIPTVRLMRNVTAKRAEEGAILRRLRKNKPTPATTRRTLVVNDKEPFREIVSGMLASAVLQAQQATLAKASGTVSRARK